MKRLLSLLIANIIVIALLSFSGSNYPLSAQNQSNLEIDTAGWTLVNPNASWEPRAGLQVLHHKKSFYLIGGRTPLPPSIPFIPGASKIQRDVWKSSDKGLSWTKILDDQSPGNWPARAYFQAVNKGKHMYILGGQNFNVTPNPACPPPFINCSPILDNTDFFNDVWYSKNGVHWTQITDSAAWTGRAGLSSVIFKGKLYVLGGSANNDTSIVTGAQRQYFNDVWRSVDGSHWTLMTDSAPWTPRAGAALVVRKGYMYLLGGENGFICDPLPFCKPPYFNDVWRSKDGANWELVSDSADWVARPGHKVAVVNNKFVLFGGFGLITNPMDVWVSNNGSKWLQISNSPWNAVSPQEIKYDFDIAVIKKKGNHPPAIFTFGGDRETFDFSDTLNYLKVDNDVWEYTPFSWPGNSHQKWQHTSPNTIVQKHEGSFQLQNAPNPFTIVTKLNYWLPTDGFVNIRVYDILGREVRQLLAENQSAGRHIIHWDGHDESQRKVASGVYFARLTMNNLSQTIPLLLRK